MRSNLKHKIFFTLFISCFIFAQSSFAAVFGGRINEDGINLRVDATVGSAIICTLSKGQSVEVVSEVYDWYKIRLPKQAPSYVRKDLVECINTNTVSNFPKCISAKVIKDRINIRLGPNESSWILGKVDKLTVINILSEQGSWLKIQPVYQSFGWVNKKFIDKQIQQVKEQESLVAPVKDTRQNDQLVIEGVVSPYGIVLWRTATHKLITSENKVYFLKGNRKSLDRLNYHKVRVSGKLITPDQSKHPIIEIDIIEALK